MIISEKYTLQYQRNTVYRLAILRIWVAILHVLRTMVPDYTRTSAQPVSLQPTTKNLSEGIRAKENNFALLGSIFGDGVVELCAKRKGSSLNEDTLSWSSTLPESHLCGRLKPHSGEKLLCDEEVNDLLHFSALCINSSLAIWAVLQRYNCSISPRQCVVFGGDPCGDLCSKALI